MITGTGKLKVCFPHLLLYRILTEKTGARLLPGWEKEAYFDDGTPVWRGEADRSSSADEAMVTPSPDLEDMDLSKFSDMDRDLYSPHTTR